MLVLEITVSVKSLRAVTSPWHTSACSSARKARKKTETGRMRSVKIGGVMWNLMHHSLTLVPGILFSKFNSLSTAALPVNQRTACVCLKGHSHRRNFLWSKAGKKSSSKSSTTGASGKIIIQKDDSLISHPLQGNLGNYILCLCSLLVLQKLLWRRLSMDYSLTLWPNRGQGTAGCKLCRKMWLWLLPSLCHLVYGEPKEHFPLKLGF